LQKDEVLTHIFQPVNTNPSLVKYLTHALELVTGIYRKDQESSKEDAFNPLYRESIFKAYTTLNRFGTLIEEGDLKVQA
jgi:hypothetical protein